MVRMILLGGFLGAGKTTTMIRAAQHLEARGERPVVLTNDQGEALVDTGIRQASGVTGGEVTGGCFCCRFDELVDTTVRLVDEHRANIVLAEAVGSCTDLAATVIQPLRQYYGSRFQVSPLTVLIDPFRYRAMLDGDGRSGEEAGEQLVYLFRKQLEEADIIVLNKVDLLSSEATQALEGQVAARFPTAQVVSISAEKALRLELLVDLWTRWTDGSGDNTLAIDYDVYAAAEAELAWLNASLDLKAGTEGGFRPARWVDRLLTPLSDALRERRAFVGHIKVQLTTPEGVTSASVVEAGRRASFRLQQWSYAHEGQVTLNARVAVAPAVLEELVHAAVAATSAETDTTSELTQWSAFRPARPVPVHRVAVEASP